MPRAPRRCPGDNYECPNLIQGGQKHCPDHTVAWHGPRTASSQATTTWEWQQLRADILERDEYQCQIMYPGICTGEATTVDKTTPAARRPDLATVRRNLRAACDACNEHKARTADRQRRR
jgi:5-methylcytosine-specific restriction protein A